MRFFLCGSRKRLIFPPITTPVQWDVQLVMIRVSRDGVKMFVNGHQPDKVELYLTSNRSGFRHFLLLYLWRVLLLLYLACQLGYVKESVRVWIKTNFKNSCKCIISSSYCTAPRWSCILLKVWVWCSEMPSSWITFQLHQFCRSVLMLHNCSWIFLFLEL